MKDDFDADIFPMIPDIHQEIIDPNDSDLFVKEEYPVRYSRILKSVILAISGLYLFVLSVSLMKEGAAGITVLFQDWIPINHIGNSLGLGWLMAYLLMSGSPVAASSLTFYATGILNELEAFTMIIGSRLGASLVVLLVGLLYVIRGSEKRKSLVMGLLSMIVSFSICLANIPVGLYVLKAGFLDSIQFKSGNLVRSSVDILVGPAIDFVDRLSPGWVMFIVGILILLVSFSLLDRCLPLSKIRAAGKTWNYNFVSKPWVMFIVGAGITLLTTSVSLSLSILVPLHGRGYIRREDVIPYIMGANITTFFDTLMAAVLLDDQNAFTIVFVSMVSSGVISLVILGLFNRSYQSGVQKIVDWIIEHKRNFLLFFIFLLTVPLFFLFS